MQIKIDTYYDITCDGCSRSWSTDFDGNHMSQYGDAGMGMATDKRWLKKAAYAAGWKCKGGKTLCPDCLEKENQIKCHEDCPHLCWCEEEWDDEPMAFCCYSLDGKSRREFLGSMAEIMFDKNIDCICAN